MSQCELGSLPFSGEWLVEASAVIQGFYGHLHPYIAVGLCVAGTIMNIITVVVLTRPTMLSPVNVLLCAVAVCDILVMSSVLVFVSHFLIAAGSRCDARDYDKFWAYFLYAHSQVTVIFHATSIWLTVLLAQIRVLTIRRATAGPSESIGSTTTIVISVATLAVIAAVNMPNMLTFEIMEIDADVWLPCLLPSTNDNDTLLDIPAESYGIIYHVRASEEDCGLLKIAYWTNGILFKVVPCLLLTLSIVALLKIISDVSTRRKTLAQVMNKKRMPRDHTTPMLVAVLSIFLVAELPQGILHVCNAIFSNATFYQTIYLNLGDLMDLLSLVNSAVNFIIYCAMSRKFRGVFLQLFFSCIPQRFATDLREEWKNLDTSRHRPSACTDLTKTEQLALTSNHRVSATSVLLRTGSRDNLPRMYTGNLLSVNDPSCDRLHKDSLAPPDSRFLSPRVSFDTFVKRNDGRSSLEIHEIRLPVPDLRSENRTKRRTFSPIRVIREFLEKNVLQQNSPQRRLNIMQFETSSVY